MENQEGEKQRWGTAVQLEWLAWQSAPRSFLPHTKRRRRPSGCPAKRQLRACHAVAGHLAVPRTRKTRPYRYGRFCEESSSKPFYSGVPGKIAKIFDGQWVSGRRAFLSDNRPFQMNQRGGKYPLHAGIRPFAFGCAQCYGQVRSASIRVYDCCDPGVWWGGRL